MGISMAATGKTDAYLYTILPTSLGVLFVALAGSSEVLFGLGTIGLTASIGSMLLYTIRPDEWLLIRTYKRYATNLLENIAQTIYLWSALFSLWRTPTSLEILDGSMESPQINTDPAERVTRNTLNGNVFLRRLWRLRVIFFAGLSVGSLIGAGIFLLANYQFLPVSLDYILPFVGLVVLYPIMLIPYWTIRRHQRYVISEFGVSLTEYYSLKFAFSQWNVSGDHAFTAIDAGIISSELKAFDEILLSEDWSLFNSAWNSFQNLLKELAKESFVNDIVSDILREWSNLILSYRDTIGGAFAERRMDAVIKHYNLSRTKLDIEYVGFENELLDMIIDSISEHESDNPFEILTSDEIVEDLMDIAHRQNITAPHRAELWIWAHRVGEDYRINRPSLREVKGRSHERYERYLKKNGIDTAPNE